MIVYVILRHRITRFSWNSLQEYLESNFDNDVLNDLKLTGVNVQQIEDYTDMLRRYIREKLEKNIEEQKGIFQVCLRCNYTSSVMHRVGKPAIYKKQVDPVVWVWRVPLLTFTGPLLTEVFSITILAIEIYISGFDTGIRTDFHTIIPRFPSTKLSTKYIYIILHVIGYRPCKRWKG